MYTIERYTPLQSEGGVKVSVRGLRGKDVITGCCDGDGDGDDDIIQPRPSSKKQLDI